MASFHRYGGDTSPLHNYCPARLCGLWVWIGCRGAFLLIQIVANATFEAYDSLPFFVIAQQCRGVASSPSLSCRFAIPVPARFRTCARLHVIVPLESLRQVVCLFAVTRHLSVASAGHTWQVEYSGLDLSPAHLVQLKLSGPWGWKALRHGMVRGLYAACFPWAEYQSTFEWT